MIISKDAKNHLTNQTPTPTHNKNSQQTRNIGEVPQFDEEHLQKSTANITVNGAKLELPKRPQECPFPTTFQYCTGSPS